MGMATLREEEYDTPPKKGQCGLCRWWTAFDRNRDIGSCQRFPPWPVVQIKEGSGRMMISTKTWPDTHPHDRCGEWTELLIY